MQDIKSCLYDSQSVTFCTGFPFFSFSSLKGERKKEDNSIAVQKVKLCDSSLSSALHISEVLLTLALYKSLPI